MTGRRRTASGLPPYFLTGGRYRYRPGVPGGRVMTGMPGQHAQLIGRAAGIIGGLAAELAVIKNALEEQAYAASRYGVNIGTDGRPPPVTGGPAADATTASESYWALAYRQHYDQAMAAAQQAKQQAARQ